MLYAKWTYNESSRKLVKLVYLSDPRRKWKREVDLPHQPMKKQERLITPKSLLLIWERNCLC